MCETCEGSGSVKWEGQVIAAQETRRLCAAVKALEKVSTAKYFGSGFIITMQDLNGKLIADPFMASGDKADEIRSALTEAIVVNFDIRKRLLQDELKMLEELDF